MSNLYINNEEYRVAYEQGFRDGEWAVYKSGTLVKKGGTVIIEPPNSNYVLVPRELMEQMIQLLNESDGENSRAADQKVSRQTGE